MPDNQHVPMVPVMPVVEDQPPDRPDISSDGGKRRTVPPRPTDAPLVPDCS